MPHLINPELVRMARFTLREGWGPQDALEKAAIVPAGGDQGGDPGGAGGPPPGPPGDPGAGGPPPGGPPPGPPGDLGAGAAGGPPPGPLDPATLQQIVTAVQQAVGGAGGPGGKGKSPKDQLQASQTKIMIHLLAQVASKLGVQVDPQMLVPPSDPASDQMAIQELQTAPMLPSQDPNAAGPGGAGPPPGGGPAGPGGPGGGPAGPGGPGGGPAGPGGPGGGPGPIAPMDASQGPIGGKAASAVDRWLNGDVEMIGQEYSIPALRENRQKAAARLALLRSLARP